MATITVAGTNIIIKAPRMLPTIGTFTSASLPNLPTKTSVKPEITKGITSLSPTLSSPIITPITTSIVATVAVCTLGNNPMITARTTPIRKAHPPTTSPKLAFAISSPPFIIICILGFINIFNLYQIVINVIAESFFILTAVFAGVLIGTLTGIAPGIHINLISAILLSASSFFLAHSSVSPMILAAFLVSIAITHTFVDFIPSIFLGAPDQDDNALSILPGHEMLNKGKAYEAVIYTLYGSFSALFIILFFSPIFFFFLPKIYPYAQRIMPFILIVSSFFLIYFEKSSRRWAIIIFLLSGILGMITLNLPLNNSLLPLFTGLFGISSLITSLSKKQKIPKQEVMKLKDIKVEKKSFSRSITASVIASPLCSFLPGMGSGQAAVIGGEVMGNLDRREFLILLGSINTVVTGLSFVTLYAIGKARTGIASAVGQLINLSPKAVIILTIIILISGFLASLVTIFCAKFFAERISLIDYSKLSKYVLAFLVSVVFIFSGWLGIILMAVSAVLGLLCIYSGIRRTHLMGCLVIPAIFLLWL